MLFIFMQSQNWWFFKKLLKLNEEEIKIKEESEEHCVTISKIIIIRSERLKWENFIEKRKNMTCNTNYIKLKEDEKKID